MAIHSSSGALVYQSGFGNQFSSEALPGALPVGQNSPQKHPLGLYAEQFSGTAFTVARSEARRTWLYRIKPSAAHPRYQRMDRQMAGQEPGPINPNRLRWNAFDIPAAPTDFIDGLIPLASTSAAEQAEGVSVYLYTANTSLQRAFFSA
ncbi:homogentisate 1,2-dioxygenase, partial [Pseudomonas syringae]|uniref:homogentisate 1,2-dioxygenase n=1 Tax=Pseudomonas syringae TaxID=317 RepID=UPI001F190C76